MNTEEKAQAYDEALERARKQKYDYQKELDKTDKSSQLAGILRAGISAIELAFPELSKSDDESIRKSIIHILQVGGYMSSEEKNKAFAYLEKMKEANKAIEVVDRIDKYIDENVANAHDMKDSNPDKKYYRGWDDALGEMARILQDVYSEEKQKEQKPAGWSEEDKTMLNNLIYAVHMKSISPFDEMDDREKYKKYEKFLTSLPERFGLEPKQEWSEEDEYVIDKVIEWAKIVNPTSTIFEKMPKERFIERLKSLRPQPKKNDMITPNKKFFQWIYDRLINVHNENPNVDYMISFKRRIEELSFDKPSWKPSKEQMIALNKVVNGEVLLTTQHKSLESLYNDLKKLI